VGDELLRPESAYSELSHSEPTVEDDERMDLGPSNSQKAAQLQQQPAGASQTKGWEEAKSPARKVISKSVMVSRPCVRLVLYQHADTRPWPYMYMPY
jgi:hypothetical protein